jgi:ethanolamine transporter EutH
VFARLIARIVVLAIAFALLGLIVGLVGKYALKMAMFDNLLLPMAVGLVVGGLLGIFASVRVESARKRAAAPRR